MLWTFMLVTQRKQKSLYGGTAQASLGGVLDLYYNIYCLSRGQLNKN